MIAIERLASLDLFLDVPRDAIAALARHGIEVVLAPNEVVFLAGAQPRGWWIVLEGRIRVVRGEGARQHVIHTEGPGGTLGEVPLFGGGSHPATGIAAEPTRCALITRSGIEAAVRDAPSLTFLISRRLAHRVRQLVDRLDERSSHSVQSRMIEFLLGRPRQADASRSLGMTQHALAEELGTVREVISRELRVLTDLGLIQRLGGGRFRVLDEAKLRAACDVGRRDREQPV